MKGKSDGDKATADNPYMLDIEEFMGLETQEKWEVLLRAIANINQTLEAMGNDLHELKPKGKFVYEYTPNIPIRNTPANTPETKVSIWKQKFPIRETPNTPEDIFRYRSQ